MTSQIRVENGLQVSSYLLVIDRQFWNGLWLLFLSGYNELMSTGLDSTFKLKGFCLILFQFSTRDAIERYDYCADPEPALVFALAHQVVITTITTPIIIIIINKHHDHHRHHHCHNYYILWWKDGMSMRFCLPDIWIDVPVAKAKRWRGFLFSGPEFDTSGKDAHWSVEGINWWPATLMVISSLEN